MKIFLSLLLAQPLFASTYCVKYGSVARERVFEGWVNRTHESSFVTEKSTPRRFVEGEEVSQEQLIELCGPNELVVERALAQRRIGPIVMDSEDGGARDEVFTLVENGPSNNRIDLVFMGDGYLESEKDKFLSDMKRLTAELFKGRTFASYLPIFNVYAVFRASQESGIGKNNVPKNTTYQLYRLGDTLRAIYVGKPSAAHTSCSAAPGCDYPILIANDPYYGGLGGEFSVSTSSVTSGMMVLRHELGHSVGDIGEEYDGGGYFGANHARNLSAIGWRHWLSGEVVSEPSQAREVSWPWVNLAQGPFSAFFTSDGRWDRVEMQISMSGAQTNEDFRLSIDRRPIAFHSPGHADRDFHSISLPQGFSSGTHELKFEEGVHDGDNWVSNITIHEFKNAYHFDPAYIGAYPLFNGIRTDGFRPTHNTCLMRNMKSDTFCPVCQENNWIKFFGSVKMIDSVSVTRSPKRAVVTVVTQPLGQFRKSPQNLADHVFIRWFQDASQVAKFDDATQVVIDNMQAQWEVEVEYSTPEVRVDAGGVLKNRKTIIFN